jgi:hypothetical protein
VTLGSRGPKEIPKIPKNFLKILPLCPLLEWKVFSVFLLNRRFTALPRTMLKAISLFMIRNLVIGLENIPSLQSSQKCNLNCPRKKNF